MLTSDLLEHARARLESAGIENARNEAAWILEEAGGAQWRGRDPVPRAVRAAFEGLIARRAAHEPLQHILSTWPFLELDLMCDARALVPRPETEDLAQRAREFLRAAEPPRIALDVGTGSGCLGAALATGAPDARVVAVDIDRRALSLAAENLVRCGVADRVRRVRGDLVSGLARAGSGWPGFALIVANLPYVAAVEWELLEPEVREHDPRIALVADNDGRALLERVADEARDLLRPEGAVMFELAPSQAERLAARLRARGFAQVEILPDRFHRPRFVTARLATASAGG